MSHVFTLINYDEAEVITLLCFHVDGLYVMEVVLLLLVLVVYVMSICISVCEYISDYDSGCHI